MGKEMTNVALLEVPEEKRDQIIKEARRKLREKAVEAKMWRWLLQIDDLTINGNVVWKKPPEIERSSA
jgi:hypothetical protein